MKKAAVAALLIILAVPLLLAVAEMPRYGDPEAPLHTHVTARYLERGVEEGGAENLVTGVLLNYRGFDTFGEVVVIFTALAAALAVLLTTAGVPLPKPAEPPSGPEQPGEQVGGTPSPSIQISPVVFFVVRLLGPFIGLFAVYVILHGHLTPGGGFQGGAILGAMFIALTVVLGEGKVRPRLPEAGARWLQGAAPLSFIVIGVIGVPFSGYFLGYPLEHSLHLVRELMMIVLEIGIGVGGAAIFARLFLAMEAN